MRGRMIVSWLCQEQSMELRLWRKTQLCGTAPSGERLSTVCRMKDVGGCPQQWHEDRHRLTDIYITRRPHLGKYFCQTKTICQSVLGKLLCERAYLCILGVENARPQDPQSDS